MNKKDIAKNLTEEQAKDLRGFYEEFQNETPRAAVILAAAFLDERLRELIVNFLVDDNIIVDSLLGTEKNADCPLSTFSSRIKVAYCLGLINKEEYDDLNSIRNIRNKFAHRLHGLSFNNSQIKDRCISLHISKMTNINGHVPIEPEDIFFTAVAVLEMKLRNYTKLIKSKRRKTTDVPEVITFGMYINKRTISSHGMKIIK